MRALVSIAVLVIGGAILADVLAHPKATKNVVDGLTNLWLTAVKGASGGYAPVGS